jgi:hypothetical protein
VSDLLGLALEGHGGLERWRSLRELVVRARSGGFALASRLQPRAFRSYEARLALAEPRVVITPFGRPGHRGIFEGEDVRIETLDGAVVAERRQARTAFSGGRRALWWDRLDALYFGGYALWNYFSLPLLLTRADVVAREIEPWDEAGERWRRLRVTFPPAVPTHCPEQVFSFDALGRLRRHDYAALVFGAWARAAHYSGEHREFAGLVLPTRRRVLPRGPGGRPLPLPTLVWIDVDEVVPAGSVAASERAWCLRDGHTPGRSPG